MTFPRSPLVLALLVLLSASHARAADDPVSLMENGHYRRAHARVEAIVASHPNEAMSHYLMARMKLIAGDPAAALPLAEKAAQQAPRSAEYRYLVAECVGLMAQRAGKLKALGLAKRFKREAEAAHALDARHVDTHEALIEFYSVAPGIAGGNDRRAHALAESLVAIDPARGRLMQASLQFRDKQYAGGEEALRRALSADSNNYRVRMSMVRFLANDTRKRWTEAESHAEAALALHPGRIPAYAALAGLYAHLERWEDLDRILAAAERAVPDNHAAHYQAGRTLLGDDREFARAERLFRTYLSREPEIGAPSHAHAQWRLGLVIEKQGRKAEALAAVETALRLKPDLDEAKKDLKRLKKG